MAEYVPLVLKSNQVFLKQYQHYVIHDWKIYYLLYDELKDMYKEIKAKKVDKESIRLYEEKFASEVQRLDSFMQSVLDEINTDLNAITDAALDVLEEQGSSKEEEFATAIKELFEKCKSCVSFYRLNYFTILKIAKKYEKLLEKMHPDEPESLGRAFNIDDTTSEIPDFRYWTYDVPSYQMTNAFAKNMPLINTLRYIIHSYTHTLIHSYTHTLVHS